jgi:TetR/AcrR family transcriptional repressor of bet genes
MPKQVDHDDRRRDIARAAIAVIERTGLDGARLRDVAQEAQATTGAVTHYFGSKDEVLEAALAEIVAEILAAEAAAFDAEALDSIETLVAGVAQILPLDEARRRQWRVWFAFWGRAVVEERLRAQHGRYYAQITGRLASLLAVLQSTGLVSPTRAPPLLADLVVAAVDGLGVRATLEPDTWPAERQVEALTAMLAPLLTD